jgi:DnaJ-domain-containing protein 1
MREGEMYLQAGNYEGATNRFEQSYNWELSFEAAFQAGFCQFKMKKFAEAELWLSKAHAFNPENEEAVVYLASAQIANYKSRQAIVLLEEFTRQHGDATRASATLAAIRSDLNPHKGAAGTASILQLFLVALVASSLLLFLASFRADNAGIREGGKGLGLVALSSFYLLSPFPALLGLGGYVWGGYKLYSGYSLFRFLRKEGLWAARMRSGVYKFAGAFVSADGTWDERRVEKALNGLLRAGMDRDSVRHVEMQLQVAPMKQWEATAAVKEFVPADRLIREVLLRLLAGMALHLGYGESEKRLLGDLAAALRLEYRISELLEELRDDRREQRQPAGSSRAHFGEPPAAADPLSPYFRILGVLPSASRAQVKSGYRKQAKRYHPDRLCHLGGEFQRGAADQFRRVQQAYEVVCKARGWKNVE